jgi:hypothetical protein
MQIYYQTQGATQEYREIANSIRLASFLARGCSDAAQIQLSNGQPTIPLPLVPEALEARSGSKLSLKGQSLSSRCTSPSSSPFDGP